jgi:hypothetical protein
MKTGDSARDILFRNDANIKCYCRTNPRQQLFPYFLTSLHKHHICKQAPRDGCVFISRTKKTISRRPTKVLLRTLLNLSHQAMQLSQYVPEMQ